MNHVFSDELPLVTALQRHTSPDFSLVYRKYAATLYGVLLRLVNDPIQAQDLLQDTFITIWLNSHHYNPDRGRLFTWLLTLTRHIGLDALRANKRRLDMNAYSWDGCEELAVSPGFEAELDKSVLSRLAPKYQTVVELIYLQGYTNQETANQLNLPLGTVKTRLRSGLQQLRVTYHQDVYHYHIKQ